MKNKVLLSLFTMVFTVSAVWAQTTAIPDVAFENYLETHDANGNIVDLGDDTSLGDGVEANGFVLTDRINAALVLSIDNLGINNLSGIEFFSSLETLICNGNNLTSLDVSNSANLKSLLCGSNQLLSINVAANTNLEDFDCSDNQISILNITSNRQLTSLDCSNNRIAAIDVSQNTDLTSLSISNNRINTLNVGVNTKLESLFSTSNQITTLDLSSNTNLKILDVSNNFISNLDLSSINATVCPDPQTDPITACQGPSSINVSNNQLVSLIVANGFNDLVSIFTSERNPDLFCIQIDAGFSPNANWAKDDWTYYAETVCDDIYTYVPDDNFEDYLETNGLGDGIPNNNFALTSQIVGAITLNIAGENIKDLTGLEGFENLEALYCSNNILPSLDVTANTKLTILDCSSQVPYVDTDDASNNYSFNSLNISNNVNLLNLNCSGNTLSTLDISNNLLLTDLDCSDNDIEILNISLHPNLVNFYCNDNSLLTLNINNGNNGVLNNFNATNNPQFLCIQVDDENNIGANWFKDGNASYSEGCGTYVPDDAFENYLESLVPSLGDGIANNNFVSTLDVNAFTGTLNIANLGISDLTGIEAFIALQALDCSNNNIEKLDLTTNVGLTSVICNDNVLEFVDVRNGNNTNIAVFNATNNSNLFCLNVDSPNYSQNAAGWTIDSIANYNDDCENNRFTAIPDDNFEQALIDLGLDIAPLDDQVLTANIEYLTSLNVSGKSIESLEGIKAFSSLTALDCSDNYLDELDVSGMLNLQELYCGSNYFLTNNIANVNGVLNTTTTPNLTKLFCADNNLADLDISLNANLEILDCSNNSLDVLDISNNNDLIEVNCDNNSISNFISYATDNFTLQLLSCSNNELSTLVASRSLALTNLNCRSNSLTSLDVISNANLEVLDFSDNKLTDVNLSATIALIALSGSNNELTEIDDLSSVILESLVLDNNQISQLSSVLNNLPSLKYLSINDNQLSDLDASLNMNLIELNVSNNDLANLQIPNNLNQLKTFNCSNNDIVGALDLTSMGIGACPEKNARNPLDFCPDDITINVSGNQLEFVNIQNGINNEILSFSATNNPNLTCIQVDDVNSVPASWLKDAITMYSLDCRFGETYVPDDNFEQALINLGYDTGALDDYVPTINIEVVTILDVSANAISDFTGIEDFTALENLDCSNNALSNIDISNNVNLTEINCSNNTLSSLDVTENPNIINLYISNNQFTEFDTSLIPLLERFNCDGNSILALNFTTNTALIDLSCASNVLEVLNLQNGQNSNISNLNAQNNPDLSCIQTDDGTAPAGVTWLKDATTAYSLDCRFGETYVPDDNFEQALIDLGFDTAPLNDYVPTSNIKNLTSLSIVEKGISDLTGIEDFESLTSLNIEGNILSTVDLIENVLLNNLNASNNQFATIDISNLTELRVLDVSNNSLLSINTNSNLGLTTLNISSNLFTTLDVSLLLDLERLNCSSNQLEALDVTVNNKLVELFCSSNAFTQDKLNIQNGTNTILRRFNASNNPDLSCILVDDPVAVVSNINGFYDDWYKDATTNYQLVCDDADNDGVANEDDLCPGTPFGEAVDLFGCPFSVLPNDNFTILITGETCLNNNDGKINITTKEFYEYKASLIGDDFDRNYAFTNEIDILNLLAGTYRLCLTSDELPSFERCFDIVINHPENLEVITSKSVNGKVLSINMSGSSNYKINFNGLEFKTSESQMTLQLESGKNTIKISTDKPCQGSYKESILLSNKMFVHPNPFQNEFNIYLGALQDDIVNISVYSYLGQLVYNEEIKRKDARSLSVDTNDFSIGLYTVFLTSKSSVSIFKIVKK
ncbi:hypothetical protein DIS18_14560 [Algibacter marinivivus]|uniref:Secretion system C-terminal sorting domain-containing protein n=1 Tax=Algibacter marinivivus TaxID=2100723 RepID=A0A2U2X166_9FLAO|nr:T9SS type A sorting domain-containing protein [Algibacter marinivivus]PWH81500.1 hypothetical protein DIS18_14560 [Algibacter marinivivus]